MPEGVEEGLAIQAGVEAGAEEAGRELPSSSVVVLKRGQKVEGGAETEN